MNRVIRFILLLSLFLPATTFSQPVSSDPAITITPLTTVKNNAVRIARCKYNDQLYYITFNGNIYKLQQDGSTWGDTLIATTADHGMNYLQGITFYDSIMYVTGNLSSAGAPGNGIVAKAVMNGGSLTWSNVLITVPYPTTATLYAHAFSSILVTDDGDSLYISSGSRTDHGEVQSINGLFPDTREVPLTSLILKIPVTLSNFILQNDSAFLDSTGFVFARGLRNNFDMAFNSFGDLIGTENSGDRDDPDELNWLRQGYHYGFPWLMGGNTTGQQYINYDPSSDPLINPNSAAAQLNYFYNDTLYPQMPSGLLLADPIKNYGPYADKFRDTLTGIINDAGDLGIYITTLTTHRSPLGLVCDRFGKLDGDYKNDAFMLCYTPGCPDSSGFNPGLGLGPFLESGQELLHLEFTKDSVDGYSVNIYPLITGITTPVDAELDSNVLYIIEHRVHNSIDPGMIWKVEFPVIVSQKEAGAADIKVYPNPASHSIYISGRPETCSYRVADLSGKQVSEGTLKADSPIDVRHIPSGLYILNFFNEDFTVSEKISILR